MKTLTPISLFGFLAANFALRRYPPVEMGTMMILLAAALIMGILSLREGLRKDRSITAAYLVASLLPWMMAGSFFANGALDPSQEIRHQTVVVERTYGSRWVPDGLVVRSWRFGRTKESLYVGHFEPLPHAGDYVTVGVKSGTFGVPWVSSIARSR
jgi:hypothetical protein